MPEPGPPSPRALLSSCTGRILHVLFVLTGALLVGAPCPAETLLRAATTIPRISIVCHRSATGRIEALLRAVGRDTGVHVVAAPDHASLWGWVQDRCLACRDAETGATILVHGNSAEAEDTARYAAEAVPGLRHTATALRLEGGNILADGDLCLLGADLAADNGAAFKTRFHEEIESRRAVALVGGTSALRRRGPTRFAMQPGDLTWREAVDRSLSRSGTRQPVFHLDMFATLAGNNRVLVGDPLAASRMIGVPLPAGFPLQAFDEIALDLQRCRLEVIRNPLPFVHFDDPAAKLREWFYAPANNAWVEYRPSARGRVWLPQYGFAAWPELKVTDDANAALWRELGFDIIPAGDFLPLADQLGALNCVSKILERAT
jgi:hypothetical protein